MLRMIIFVVLMVFWLFGGGYVAMNNGRFDMVLLGGHLIPWCCVAILGWCIFSKELPK